MKIRGAALAVLAAVGPSLSASPVMAEGVPQEVSIDAHLVRGCPTADSCVFAATGAIDDQSVIKLESVKAFALPSPVVGTAQYVRTFIGIKGSLTIRLESRIRPTDDPAVWREEDRWVVVSATGSYAPLDGWEASPAAATSRPAAWTSPTSAMFIELASRAVASLRPAAGLAR
jgi:hypothetical protein